MISAEKITSEEERSPEPEAIMESAAGKRAGILSKYVNRKTAEVVGVLTPGVDVGILLTYAARGETFTGEELDGRQRINQAAIAGFLVLFYALHLSGMTKEAWTARGIAASIASIEFGPDILDKASKMAEEKAPGIASFIKGTGAFLKDQQSVVKDSARAMVNLITANPDLVLLNLNEQP